MPWPRKALETTSGIFPEKTDSSSLGETNKDREYTNEHACYQPRHGFPIL